MHRIYTLNVEWIRPKVQTTNHSVIIQRAILRMGVTIRESPVTEVMCSYTFGSHIEQTILTVVLFFVNFLDRRQSWRAAPDCKSGLYG